ncbi:MAG: NAD(P)/FAD-dependent oxidoreductase [Turicibacter sp.]|nr:NAD(P)/FAD-dependent oxidoreductase [Turicibacter sp.]
MAENKKVVILGAGYSGVLIAKKLEKKLKKAKKLDGADITIIDKNPFHTMLTELHEVAAWRVDEEAIRLDLKKIFAGRKVNVVQDHIVKTDYANNTLIGENGQYDYDHLVMASGCKTTYWGVPGAEENTFPLWSFQEAVVLRDHIMRMFREASIEKDIERKRELLTFFVIGAGFTGVEMVGELAELAPILCKRFHINPELLNINIVDMLPGPMPFLAKKAIDRSVRRMEKMGINQIYNASVKEVQEDGLVYEVDGNTITQKSETVIWVTGTEGSDIVMQSEELGLVERSRGRVQTDKHLRSVQHPNVYVAGDNTFYIPEGEDKPIPQMVEHCEHCAPIIAKNILKEIFGGEPSEAYAPKFKGAMVCIGGRYGTAYGGLPGKFFVMPSFFAMFAKHFINIMYFVQVLGWNKVFKYIKTQFFTIRNERSFVGGHFANQTSTFWTVPLRVIAGVYLCYLGYRRIMMGWIDGPLLQDMFYDIAGSFRPIAPFPMTDISLFDYFRFTVHIINDSMMVWFRSVPVDSFLQTFVIPNQMFWQWSIVLFEFAIGLALIAGLFTKLAGIGIIAWAVIALATVGLSIHQFWMPFAGIAFFAAGKVLSLDYYVGPWLAKKWRNIPFVKKWYLYND